MPRRKINESSFGAAPVNNQANARKTHCPRGHEYTPENTYTYGGGRQCITCRKITDDAYQIRKRNARKAAQEATKAASEVSNG